MRSARYSYARLTGRELEYIALVCRRMEPTRAQIAQYMGCAEKTVEAHRAKVYRKLGVHTRLELLYTAVEMGLVPCPCGGRHGEHGGQAGGPYPMEHDGKSGHAPS